MRNRALLLAVAGMVGMLLCGFLPGTVQAGNLPYSVSLSPFAGGYLFERNQHLANKPVYGLAIGFNFTPSWGIEAVYSGIPDTHSTKGAQTTLTVHSARGDILYHFLPEQRFVPYAAVGAGLMLLDPRQGNIDKDILADYGVGFKYFLTDCFALRADVRHIFDIPTNNTVRTRDHFNHFAYTGGFTFQIGGKRPAPRIGEEKMPVKEAEAPRPAPVVVPAPVVEPPPAPAPPLAPVVEKAPEPVPVVAAPASPAEKKAAPAPEPKTVVTGVNIVQDGVEIVATGGIRTYNAFTLSRPLRLVIDVNHAANGLNAKVVPVNRFGIAEIRLGDYPDQLRIVLDAAGKKLPAYRIVETGKGLKVILKGRR